MIFFLLLAHSTASICILGIKYAYTLILIISISGFSIEGPSQAKIECHDNGDGSADVRYYPVAPGEYAVHILCDNEDIPKSPYMANILPKSNYYPDKVLYTLLRFVNSFSFF